MNKVYLSVFLLLFSAISLIGQNAPQTRFIPTAYQISYPRTIKLNGTVRADFGGISRTVIRVEIPKGLIEWHYVFTTSSNAQFIQDLQLLGQVTEAVLAFSPGGAAFKGLTHAAIQAITVPSGSMPINTYVIPEESVQGFLNKSSDWGMYTGYEMMSTMDGKMRVPNFRNRTNVCYLALENNNTTRPVNIRIEIVGIRWFDTLLER